MALVAAPQQFHVRPNCPGSSGICGALPPQAGVHYNNPPASGRLPVTDSEFQQDTLPFATHNAKYAAQARRVLAVARAAPFVITACVLFAVADTLGLFAANDSASRGGGLTDNVFFIGNVVVLAACYFVLWQARNHAQALAASRDSAMQAHCNSLNALPRYANQRLNWRVNSGTGAVVYAANNNCNFVRLRVYFPTLDVTQTPAAAPTAAPTAVPVAAPVGASGAPVATAVPGGGIPAGAYAYPAGAALPDGAASEPPPAAAVPSAPYAPASAAGAGAPLVAGVPYQPAAAAVAPHGGGIGGATVPYAASSTAGSAYYQPAIAPTYAAGVSSTQAQAQVNNGKGPTVPYNMNAML